MTTYTRVEKRSSDIHKMGLFTTAPIQAGESVLIWGGSIFSWDDIHAGKAADRSFVALSIDLHYGNPAAKGCSITDFANHSCDPNLRTVETKGWIARRPIDKGEELTIDYATYWGPEDKETITWECHCGSSHCRSTFTSLEWMKKDLPERYAGISRPLSTNASDNWKIPRQIAR